jgi:hypothetical protein
MLTPALAEALGCELLTGDRPLASASGQPHDPHGVAIGAQCWPDTRPPPAISHAAAQNR